MGYTWYRGYTGGNTREIQEKNWGKTGEIHGKRGDLQGKYRRNTGEIEKIKGEIKRNCRGNTR